MERLDDIRAKIAEAKAAAQLLDEPEPGPARRVILAGFAFVAVLIGLALYFIHALMAAPQPVLPVH